MTPLVKRMIWYKNNKSLSTLKTPLNAIFQYFLDLTFPLLDENFSRYHLIILLFFHHSIILAHDCNSDLAQVVLIETQILYKNFHLLVVAN